MPRIRWAAHLLAAALLAVGWRGVQPAAPPAAGPLEGTWVIDSVLRDGEPDPAQAGGTMTFTGGAVLARPAAVRFSSSAYD
jgi:hypothetical protein